MRMMNRIVICLLVTVIFIYGVIAITEDCGCNIQRDSVSDGTVERTVDRSFLGCHDRLSGSNDANMVAINGGQLLFGTNSLEGYSSDFEGPPCMIMVDDFDMDIFEVSNSDFLTFVEATGYVTDSERFGWSFVFYSAIPKHISDNITQSVKGAEWWLPVDGTSWKYPESMQESVFESNRGDHPAVHISWTDADTYCKWMGKRLPSEIEFEYAAKGSVINSVDPESDSGPVVLDSDGGILTSTSTASTAHIDHLYPWGSKLYLNNSYHANLFQGIFPNRNSHKDGYEYLSPVDALGPQNGYGIHNIIGNAWEWVSDSWVEGTEAKCQFAKQHKRETSLDLTSDTDEVHANLPPGVNDKHHLQKVKKGGSFLCHKSYCNRYRIASRTGSSVDSASLNTGFRCAKDSSTTSSTVP